MRPSMSLLSVHLTGLLSGMTLVVTCGLTYSVGPGFAFNITVQSSRVEASHKVNKWSAYSEQVIGRSQNSSLRHENERASKCSHPSRSWKNDRRRPNLA
ncbi:hypothetical protein BDQ12DRAFT_335463 [Crucibulum laeve]|uniref:Uncharacterized protein n=1 Tax=Crucibulum laeve TaxID=68775 RepID=A0A5C3LP85_9AGAR|nr:hypothetical protein BDQ12DRAFT_335463 [Crucibulum laeve]